MRLFERLSGLLIPISSFHIDTSALACVELSTSMGQWRFANALRYRFYRAIKTVYASLAMYVGESVSPVHWLDGHGILYFFPKIIVTLYL